METPLFERYRIAVDPGQEPIRIDKFLVTRLPNVSRNRIQAGIKQGAVLVSQKSVKANYLVKPQDIIQVFLPTSPRTDHIVGEDIPLNIVYEDQDLLVVNKEALMVVHPAHENWTGTLVNALVYQFDQLPAAAGNEGRPGLVHRIDKGTSGLLVIAKNEESLTHLAHQFMQHSVEREYRALVWGDLPQEQGTINVPIGRSPKDRRIMIAYPPTATGGKKAITHYQVIERIGYVTLVACRLETGRTHQIRAHMHHLGHPLFADPRYGGNQILQGQPTAKYRTFVQRNFTILPHQALHAQTLGFIHPRTKEKMSFEAPLPAAFQQLLDRWRVYTTARPL